MAFNLNNLNLFQSWGIFQLLSFYKRFLTYFNTGIPSSDTTKAFVGEITRLNVWKNRMEVTERARILGRGCGFWNGNVLPWCELRSNLFGNVNLIPNSECFIPG